MATLSRNITVSESWVNIRDVFNLLPGINYSLYNNGPIEILLSEQLLTPTDTDGFVIVLPNIKVTIVITKLIGIWVKVPRVASSIISLEEAAGAISHFLLNRPFTDTGLSTGNNNMAVDGSVTNIDFFVQALPTERLSVTAVNIHIEASGNVTAGSYGDIAGGLTNGIKLIFKRAEDNLVFDIGFNLVIQVNEDWGKFLFDATPVTYPVGQTNFYQAKWSLFTFNDPFGLILEEGDAVGVRIQDDLSSLVNQTLLAQGVSFGGLNPSWVDILTPLNL